MDTNKKKNLSKKTPQGRISRRDQLKMNPVPWVILIVISLLLYFFLASSKVSEWRTNKIKIQEFNKNIESNTEEAAKLKVLVAELQEEFQEKAGERLKKERDIFPAAIDTKKIVKTLEIFILKLKLIESKEDIRLNTLSVGQTSSPDANLPETEKRQISFSVDIDQEELETLIWYLQNNKLPPRMIAAKESGKFKSDLNDYIYLEANPLPLMLIENINKSGGGLNENGSRSSTFNVSISGNIYHQALTPENE